MISSCETTSIHLNEDELFKLLTELENITSEIKNYNNNSQFEFIKEFPLINNLRQTLYKETANIFDD